MPTKKVTKTTKLSGKKEAIDLVKLLTQGQELAAKARLNITKLRDAEGYLFKWFKQLYLGEEYFAGLDYTSLVSPDNDWRMVLFSPTEDGQYIDKIKAEALVKIQEKTTRKFKSHTLVDLPAADIDQYVYSLRVLYGNAYDQELKGNASSLDESLGFLKNLGKYEVQLSKNPLDMVFAGTDTPFRSCMRLDTVRTKDNKKAKGFGTYYTKTGEQALILRCLEYILNGSAYLLQIVDPSKVREIPLYNPITETVHMYTVPFILQRRFCILGEDNERDPSISQVYMLRSYGRNLVSEIYSALNDVARLKGIALKTTRSKIVSKYLTASYCSKAGQLLFVGTPFYDGSDNRILISRTGTDDKPGNFFLYRFEITNRYGL